MTSGGKQNPVHAEDPSTVGLDLRLRFIEPISLHRGDPSRQQFQYNRREADHGRLKARLRPLRGLKTNWTVRVVMRGHAFVSASFHDPAYPVSAQRDRPEPTTVNGPDDS